MTETMTAPPAPPVGGPRGGIGAGMVTGLVTLGVLTIAVPGVLMTEVADVGRSNAWPLTLAVLVWAGIRLSLLVGRGEPRLFDFFFWLFTYIFMGLAPTVQMRSGRLSLTTPGMDPALDLAAAVIVVVGLVAYEIGRAVAVRGERRRSARPDPDGARDADRAVVLSETRTAILFLVGAVIAAYFVSRLGFAASLGSRDEANIARQAAFPDPVLRSVITAAALYPLLVALGGLVQVRAAAATAARRRLIALCVIVSLALLFSVVSPISSARYALGTVVFAVAVFAGALATPARIRTTMIATIVGFLFVFPLADAFRRADGQQAELAGQPDPSGFFGEYQYNSDYDGFWQIANAFSYWRDGLVEPLRQFSGSVLFWFPRGIWEDKPPDTGALLAGYRGYRFENLSAPLWAEALMNGGIVALVIVFLLVGFWLRRFDTRVVTSRRGGAWAVAAAVIPVYMTILLRGSLLQATGAVVIAVLCIAFLQPSRRRADARAADADTGSTGSDSEPPQGPVPLSH